MPPQLKDMANAIRALAMDAVEAAKCGHPGMPMGMADVASVLLTRFLKFDAAAPEWPDRDRLVLSAGHGSMLLYALLYLTGAPRMTIDEIRNFRQLGSLTPGHPEYGHTPGVETTTGPLGQGLANAVGMAMAEAHLRTVFGAGLVDHRTYVIASDGDLMEGISHEAAGLAGHLKLDRLVVLFDDNGITIDGPLGLSDRTDQIARFKAYGWAAERVDGHDGEAVAAAIARAQASDRPSLIACRTVIGYGAPTKQGTSATHGAALGADEIAGARDRLGWTSAPFEIPGTILEAWREAGRRGAPQRAAWEARKAALAADTRGEFERRVSGALDSRVDAAIVAAKKAFSAEGKPLATRRASGAVLDRLDALLPELVSGSADLAGSNNTRAKAMAVLDADRLEGRFVNYGIREHAMAAAMNGMALHRGVLPASGTFLVFSDYCRPAIRLAALMGLRVVHVMTHDSIGVGEDGPTHQPVEQLASLRAMPNLHVFRPADAVEVAECWALALSRADGPSLLALSRQDLPILRTAHTDENRSAAGAYEILSAEGAAEVTIIATGSEVTIAAAAREALVRRGHPTRVVSMPCQERFDALDAKAREAVLGDASVRVAVEAASGFGWSRYLRPQDRFVGMGGFGASAPYMKLYEHFGITAEGIAAAAEEALATREQTGRSVQRPLAGGMTS
ncbi:MAG: transketolase [Alphaproteobacteria bacterium]|nr:transketolase [Alphaproteobacteria bacterium]